MADVADEQEVPIDVPRVLTVVFCGLAALLFYWLVIPGNVVENIDGYEYARAVESLGAAQVHDVRAAGFHKLNALGFSLWSRLTGLHSGFDFLVLQSMLSAVAALGLFAYVLCVGGGVTAGSAALGAGLLGVSYGYMRYAVAAELYLPSIALILATVALLVRAEVGHRWQRGLGLSPMIAPGVLAGFTTLYYLPNAIAVFLAMPALLLARGRVLRSIAYATVGGVTLFSGLITLYVLRGADAFTVAGFIAFLGDRNDQLLVPAFGLSSLAKAGNSLVHVVTSTHWIWSFDAFVSWATHAIPKRVYHLEDVIQAVRALGIWSNIGLVSFLAVVAFALRAFWVRATAANTALLARDMRGAFGARVGFFFAAWFVLQAAITTRLDPAAEEAWIILLAPLAGLGTIFLIAPLVERGRAGVAVALVLALGVHNIVGGHWFFRHAHHEYRAQRLDDVARVAKVGDAIVFMGQEFFLRSHAHYRLGLTVLEVNGGDARVFNIDARAMERVRTVELVRRLHADGRRVFVLGEQLTQTDRIVLREGEAALQGLRAFNLAWQSKLRKIADGPRGVTFEIVD